MSNEIPKFLANPDPQIYRSGTYVVVDFETTTEDKGDALNPNNDILLAVWMVVKEGKPIGRWKVANECLQKKLIEDIRDVDFVVAHNAKFELQWLKRCGLDLHNVLVYDTQIAEYVLAGNRKRKLNLEDSCSRHGLDGKESFVSKLIKAGVDTRYIPRAWLLKYCKRDVWATYALFQKQLEVLSDKLLTVQYCRCLVTPCLADIENNGATLDPDRVREMYDATSRELAEVEAELTDMSGGINIGSSHQLAHWLYGDLKFTELKKYGKVDRNQPNKQFPDGMPKTDVTTISQLKDRTKQQARAKELLLKQSKLSAKLDKNLKFFLAVCQQNGCKFHPTFNQTVTVTHRLSASGRKLRIQEGKKVVEKGAQFQNFPREMKPLFCASDKDRLIGEADWSQLEFRIAGHLGRDEQIREDVVNDEDIHAVTARTLTEAGEPTSRQEAKASTFRPLFAGRSGTPAIVEYCDFFRQKYRGISDEQLQWGGQAMSSGEGAVETEWGLIFYYPGTRVRQDGTYTNFTNISNYPIQSFSSADINLVALTIFWHLSKDRDFRIINTIHDSIISDIPEDSVEQYTELVVKCMLQYTPALIRKLYNIELYVPLGAGIKVGRHWNEPLERDVIPTSVAGFETRIKDNGAELQFDQHRTVA